MAGFRNDTMYANNVDFTGSATVSPTVTTNGQLLIGSTASPNIRVGTLTSPLGTITIGYSSPNITIDLAGSGLAIDSINVDASTAPGTNPVAPNPAGQVTITGAQVATGVIGTNVIRTDSLAPNTFTIEIQRSTAVAASDVTKNGVSHFDSARFTVGANGFVSLNGSGVGETITGDTGGALSPTAGNWNIVGGTVVAGSTPVATAGAVSTLTVNVQRSQAIASTDSTKIGLAAFNSAQFTVDANGFVSSNGSGFTWIDQATSITLVKNTGYFVTAATTQTLPASPAQGDVVKIVADTSGAVVVTANTGQKIRLGNLISSTAGTMTSTLQGDCMELVFRAATSTWISIANNGVWVAA